MPISLNLSQLFPSIRAHFLWLSLPIIASCQTTDSNIISYQLENDVSSLTVYQLIDQRLSYMHDVALYKYQQNLPIEQLGQETIVINKAKASAQSKGIDPASIETFFSAQITVAKNMQQHYFRQWQTNDYAKSHQPRDLKTVIRPQLLQLGNEIIDAIKSKLSETGPFTQPDQTIFFAQIKTANISDTDKALLFDALQKIRLQ